MAKSGWLVRCVGGPLDKGFVRSWQLQPTPQAEAEALQERFSVEHCDGPKEHWGIDTRGEYVLRVTEKTSKFKGETFQTREYVWTTY